MVAVPALGVTLWAVFMVLNREQPDMNERTFGFGALPQG